MKIKGIIVAFVVGCVVQAVSSSCAPAPMVVVAPAPKKAPPGQVKKVTGSQSAKPYAPGQQKKKKF
jgi:hypothetical protein